MNEEEAIKYLKKKIEDCNHIIEASSYIGNKKAYAKERTKYKEILNLIKNQQSELDKKDVTIIETKEANRQLCVELQKKDKIIDEIEDLCIRKGDDEGEEYGGVIIWNFAHKIMDIIKKGK